MIIKSQKHIDIRLRLIWLFELFEYYQLFKLYSSYLDIKKYQILSLFQRTET